MYSVLNHGEKGSRIPSLADVGLLLMRLSLGFALIHLGAAAPLQEPLAIVSVVHQIIGVAAGAFLIAGLWTKVTASLAALDQIWIALSFLSLQRGNDITHALLASLCASVAMLGPGALSIDWQSYRRWISGRRIISNSQKE